MGNITSQVIVHLSVNDSSDHVVANGCKNLHVKALLSDRDIESQIVKVRCAPGLAFPFSPVGVKALTSAFKRLGSGSRVYLCAHGDWKTQKLADASADECAELLSRAGMPAVKVVSVLGCNCARDLGSDDANRISLSMDSFAGNLHLILGVIHGIRTTVFARSFFVAIKPDGSKRTGSEDEIKKRQRAFPHKRTFSKWMFFWEGNRPRRGDAYSGRVVEQGAILDEFEL